MPSYETGSATGIQDLLSKLFTFLTATIPAPDRWTQDEFNTTNRYATINDGGSCYASFRWDNTTQEQFSLFQSLGFSGPSVTPENHTDDSGQGQTTVPVTTQRRVDLQVSGALTAYHFFAGDVSRPYCHVVVEYSPGLFRHFGFGNLVKLNDWTGGEYSYGGAWSQVASYIDNPSVGNHAMGMDDSVTVLECPTIHVEGLPGQDGSSKWLVVTSNAAPGNDRGSNPRLQGRASGRGGLWGYALAWIPTSQLNSYKPLIPIDVVYQDTSGTTDSWRPLGRQPDIAVVNIKNLSVAEEITIGSETWIVFPWVRKQFTLGNVEESWNAGWAYRKA